MKFCKDCKFYVRSNGGDDYDKCKHPKLSRLDSLQLVRGDMSQGYTYCEIERKFSLPFVASCGFSGKLFETKSGLNHGVGDEPELLGAVQETLGQIANRRRYDAHADGGKGPAQNPPPRQAQHALRKSILPLTLKTNRRLGRRILLRLIASLAVGVTLFQPFEKSADSVFQALGKSGLATRTLRTPAEAAELFVRYDRAFEPDAARHAVYAEKHALYQKLFSALQPVLTQLK